jgi:hypothetical protein
MNIRVGEIEITNAPEDIYAFMPPSSLGEAAERVIATALEVGVPNLELRIAILHLVRFVPDPRDEEDQEKLKCAMQEWSKSEEQSMTKLSSDYSTRQTTEE